MAWGWRRLRQGTLLPALWGCSSSLCPGSQQHWFGGWSRGWRLARNVWALQETPGLPCHRGAVPGRQHGGSGLRVPFSLEPPPRSLPFAAEADPDVCFDLIFSVLGVNSCSREPVRLHPVTSP